MTKTTTYRLTLVLFSTLALGGCGKDPYVGDSTPAGAGGTLTGIGGSMAGSGGATTNTSTAGPDAGTPDAPYGASTTSYVIAVAPARLLDLVFMIDNSPSMAPKQAKMNAQFPKLIAALKDPNDGTPPDLRIAILDSDLGTGGQYPSGSCGPKTLSDGTLSNYGDIGRFQMRGATACGVTDPNATYLEYTKGAPVNFTGDINTVFACLAGGVGTIGCGEEHQLQAFEFAFVAENLGDINDQQRIAFLRPNAYLGLVFLTDEDDCSAAPNDGMFGDKTELRGESASLRCYTRSHACNGQPLTQSPPGYPTSAAFQTSLTNCSARMGDTCNGQDVSQPTTCNPLRDVKTMADEIKGLKSDPDNQIFVAGIFGWPLSGTDPSTAQYKIDAIPNPNTADTAHPTVYDTWPVCYDPNHKPANASTFDPVAAGWGATPGLRESAFVDQFGANGQKFSICEGDFTASMTQIGSAIAKKLQNLCINDKLVDQDLVAPGLQPDCTVRYRTPVVDSNGNLTYVESPNAIPLCPAGATGSTVSADCWQLTSDTTKCPSAFNGQLVNVLRTQAEIAAGPLPTGTKIGMTCQICSTDPSAAGCNY